jgi:hypothetical protein
VAYGWTRYCEPLGSSLSRPLSRGFTPPRDRRPGAYKARGGPFFAGASCSFRLAYELLLCFSLANLLLSIMWIGDLNFMASTRCQQITHSYTHNSIVELGFQFPTHPNPSDASELGCAAHLDLSAMDASASVNDLRSQVPPAVGQGLPSARTASPRRTEKSLIPTMMISPPLRRSWPVQSR